MRDQLGGDWNPLLGNQDANGAEAAGADRVHLEPAALEQARDALVLEESFDQVRFGLECRGVADFPGHGGSFRIDDRPKRAKAARTRYRPAT